MSNNSSITAASPVGGTRGSHARANSTQGEPLPAGVKRERAADAGTTSPAQSPSASQQSTPAPSYGHGHGPESKKRKSAVPGSRGVANLTPEQLAKKRANGTYKPIHESESIFPDLDMPPGGCTEVLGVFGVASICFSFFLFWFLSTAVGKRALGWSSRWLTSNHRP